ncbi:DUF4249 domain-containing protein [Algoriphagus lacus]|uniref:DUF4249 domain-containing protein n=1 Tax=Algoriphagus lacus TaxID=2056311 RepID=A0A418PX63_9BACT|nr:DUF4249 family protein [Algoriphagus lacus]RIW18740.1 DUF4249 domain-containing protein [Algoriphagus lacus]
MNRLRIIGLLAVLLAFNSCVEQITFPLEKPETERLIVSGTFTDLDEKHTVLLSETTSKARQPLFSGGYFTLDDKPRPVQNAQVYLLAPEVNGSWLYREVKPGQYELEGDYAIREGLTYFLEIQVANKTYRSTPQKMPEVIGADDLSFSFERTRLDDNPEAAQVVIRTEATLPEQVGGYYLRWAVDEAYFWDLTFFPNPFNTPPPPCYVFEVSDAERITLVNGDLLNKPGGKSSQILAKRLVDQSFLSRHYFNVRQLSIDKQGYEYWRKVRELVNNTGSVFDTPPAPIRGNLFNVNDPEEVVLGYFEVAKANVTRIYTTRADVPFFLEEICAYIPGKRATEYKPTCLSCNAFPNSTNVMPKWWFDQ